ncbi:MAG: serine/threonine-protein kinase [Myxococcota bacterium]
MSESHPTIDELTAWTGGDDNAKAAWDAHMTRCEQCQSLVGLLDVGEDDEADLGPSMPDDGEGERFDLLGRLGHGGMGEAWLAYDTRLGREVVLKLPRTADPVAARALMETLAKEAVLTAGLSHPSIVAVYEAGRLPDGRPFYAMPYIAGTDLEDEIASRPDFGDRIRLLPRLAAIAYALAHAHERGVVHRDVKPCNIRLGRNSETTLLDWGLAGRVRETDGTEGRAAAADVGPLTAAGVGTPGYMAPEQSEGALPMPAMDVYGLGATLVHLLSGRAPSVSAPVRDLPPQSPSELRSLCSRALASQPEQRLPDASSFARELQSFLDGRLLATHEYGAGERMLRFAREHWRVLALAGLAMVTAGSLWALRGRAERAETRARDLDRRVENELARSLSSEAELLSDQVGRRGEALVRAVRADARDGLDDASQRATWRALGSVLARGPTTQWIEQGAGAAIRSLPNTRGVAHVGPGGVLRRFKGGHLSDTESVRLTSTQSHRIVESPSGEAVYVDGTTDSGIADWEAGSYRAIEGSGPGPNPGCWLDDETLVVGLGERLARVNREGVIVESVEQEAVAAFAGCLDAVAVFTTVAGELTLWDGGDGIDRREVGAPTAEVGVSGGSAWIVGQNGQVSEVSCAAPTDVHGCELAVRGTFEVGRVHLPAFDSERGFLAVSNIEADASGERLYVLRPGEGPELESRARFRGFINGFSPRGDRMTEVTEDTTGVLVRPTNAPWLATRVDSGSSFFLRTRSVADGGGYVWAANGEGTLLAHVGDEPGRGGVFAHGRDLLSLERRGHAMVSTSADGTVVIRSMEGLVASAQLDDAVVAVAPRAESPTVAVADASGSVWTWRGHDPPMKSAEHAFVVRALAWNDDGTVRSFDAGGHTRGIHGPAVPPPGEPAVVSLEPSITKSLSAGIGARISGAGAERRFELWGLVEGEPSWQVRSPALAEAENSVLGVYPVSRGRVLVATESAAVVVTLDRERASEWAGRLDEPTWIETNPEDASWFATIDPDFGIRVHNLDGESESLLLEGEQPPTDVAMNVGARRLVALSGEEVTVWNLDTRRPQWSFSAPGTVAIEYGPERRWIWLGMANGSVRAVPADPTQLRAVACERLENFNELAAQVRPMCSAEGSEAGDR